MDFLALLAAPVFLIGWMLAQPPRKWEDEDA
jgi:hypothetical protein